jgi:hypothetical protein
MASFTPIMELLEGGDDVLDAVQQLAFGEFQLQQVRRQPTPAAPAHQADQLALAQLVHRQVDRDPHFQPLAQPLTGLPAGWRSANSPIGAISRSLPPNR